MQTNRITRTISKRQEALKSRIFWLNFHIRSPTSGRSGVDIRYHDWQTHDIVWDLEEHAGRIMKSAGVELIELQHAAHTANPAWWDDIAHPAQKHPENMFQHNLVQIALNYICSA